MRSNEHALSGVVYSAKHSRCLSIYRALVSFIRLEVTALFSLLQLTGFTPTSVSWPAAVLWLVSLLRSSHVDGRIVNNDLGNLHLNVHCRLGKFVAILRCRANRETATFLLSIIILSGNVSVNPGPVTKIATQLPSKSSSLGLQPSDLQLVTTPTDGHCLFHATRLSLLHQHNISLSVANIIDAVRSELYTNYAEYTAFGFVSFDDFPYK